MKTIAPFAAAEQEIEAALAASRDPTALRRVIDEALQDIASGLKTHAQIGRSPCRRCDLPSNYPYSIIYTETATEIQVIAFQHHKRRTNYWKSRLP